MVQQLVNVDPGCYVDRVEIARGGMGRISAARDKRLGRAVALKELCVDQPETRARLAREALLTARLAHPAIVAVHEAGRWPDGRPFIAMKLVAGRSLDRVIADKATLAQRLALLPHILAVADALAYAHQQRVIHRDLKPHNVLVGEFGETVVIDWGLAKDLEAVEAHRDEPSGPHAVADASATVDGDVLGTPAYMPPEQAAGAAVDERADVYAIGAMLYHLLAGQAPYGRMAGPAVVATLQEEPPEPLAELMPDAPADLLAIVARAMARDPEDRYANARGLAEDLHKFHAGQLVGAHRYSWRELARRWMRRNRRAVSVAGVSLMVLAVFGVATLTRIVRAEHRAQDERVNAERRRADAEELLDFMLGDLREKLRPLNQLGLLESVAHKARDYFEHRPDDLGTDDLRKHAVALLNLGDVLVANGHTDGALAEYRRALQLARGLVVVSPCAANRGVLAQAHAKVADVLKAHGDVAGAAAAYREAIQLGPLELPYLRDLAFAHGKLGDVVQRQGDPEHALAEYRLELGLRTALGTTDPGNRMLQHELAANHLRIGTVLRIQGKTATALGEYATALAIGESIARAEPTNAIFQRDLAMFHERIAGALEVQQKMKEALVEARTSLALRQKLFDADPSNMGLLRDLSVSHFTIAEILYDSGDVAGSVPEYHTDLELTQQLAHDDPHNLDLQRDLLISESRYGDVLVAHEQLPAAIEAYRTALVLAEKLAGSDATNLQAQHDLAMSHQRLADALSDAGEHREALLEYRIELVTFAELVVSAPTNLLWEHGLANIHGEIGQTLIALGQRDDGIDELRRHVDLAARTSAGDPANQDWKTALADSRHILADALAARPKLAVR